MKEVRAAHAASTLAYSAIADVVINVKKQNVKPLCDTYEAQRAEFIEWMKNRKQDEEIPFPADMETMDIVRVPMEALQRILFERISTPTRALSLVAVLDRTIQGLNNYIKLRNELCNDFRKTGVHPAIFYGLPLPNGRDDRYRSTLKAIRNYIDDVIHFSIMLGNDLVKYANAERAKLPSRRQALVPTIANADFSKAADMLPDPANYRDWETMFVRAEPPPW